MAKHIWIFYPYDNTGPLTACELAKRTGIDQTALKARMHRLIEREGVRFLAQMDPEFLAHKNHECFKLAVEHQKTGAQWTDEEIAFMLGYKNKHVVVQTTYRLLRKLHGRYGDFLAREFSDYSYLP